MKKIILALLAALSAAPAAAGSPKRLSSFPGILEALKSGRQVRAVIDYKKCKLLALKKTSAEPSGPSETADPACALTVQNKPQSCYYEAPESLNAAGSMRLDTWEYFGPGFIGPRGYVAASETKLIGIRGFVLNYAALKIYDDNTVTVRVNYLKPAVNAAPAAQEETPLTIRKDQPGVTGKRLEPQDYLIVMDEQFSCAVNDGRDGGAAFFAD